MVLIIADSEVPLNSHTTPPERQLTKQGQAIHASWPCTPTGLTCLLYRNQCNLWYYNASYSTSTLLSIPGRTAEGAAWLTKQMAHGMRSQRNSAYPIPQICVFAST
mmetsp:Transcript_43274/g.70506  ORF Transcript_43274/g.70506 Transcript_43274/m.70506 type:complete len:106 (+) Transcript_43274:293-610(+)